jgi:hypothetical protein
MIMNGMATNTIRPDRNIQEQLNAVALPAQTLLILLQNYLRSPNEIWRVRISEVFEEHRAALQVALGEQPHSAAPVGRPRLATGLSSPAAHMEVCACLKETQSIVVAALTAWLNAPSGATKARLETARRREADLFQQLGHGQPTKKPPADSARGKVRTRPTKATKPETQGCIIECLPAEGDF